MRILFQTLFGTIGVIALIIHNFMSLCLMLGKEIWVENFCKKHIPNMHYDERFIFSPVRMMFLSIFILGNISTDYVLYKSPFILCMVILAVAFSLGYLFRLMYQLHKKQKELEKTKNESKEINEES